MTKPPERGLNRTTLTKTQRGSSTATRSDKVMLLENRQRVHWSDQGAPTLGPQKLCVSGTGPQSTWVLTIFSEGHSHSYQSSTFTSLKDQKYILTSSYHLKSNLPIKRYSPKYRLFSILQIFSQAIKECSFME